jgi:hypothetical protein
MVNVPFAPSLFHNVQEVDVHVRPVRELGFDSVEVRDGVIKALLRRLVGFMIIMTANIANLGEDRRVVGGYVLG